jgi:hypothetical protein
MVAKIKVGIKRNSLLTLNTWGYRLATIKYENRPFRKAISCIKGTPGE